MNRGGKRLPGGRGGEQGARTKKTNEEGERRHRGAERGQTGQKRCKARQREDVIKEWGKDDECKW